VFIAGTAEYLLAVGKYELERIIYQPCSVLYSVAVFKQQMYCSALRKVGELSFTFGGKEVSIVV
jgi:hypothetical protein